MPPWPLGESATGNKDPELHKWICRRLENTPTLSAFSRRENNLMFGDTISCKTLRHLWAITQQTTPDGGGGMFIVITWERMRRDLARLYARDGPRCAIPAPRESRTCPYRVWFVDAKQMTLNDRAATRRNRCREWFPPPAWHTRIVIPFLRRRKQGVEHDAHRACNYAGEMTSLYMCKMCKKQMVRYYESANTTIGGRNLHVYRPTHLNYANTPTMPWS